MHKPIHTSVTFGYQDARELAEVFQGKKPGYRPLRYDGLKKVLLGVTTIEEIEQNTSFEWAT